MRILKQSHSVEKLKRGDHLGFFKIQFAAKYQTFQKKVAQCRKKFKGGPIVSSGFASNVKN